MGEFRVLGSACMVWSFFWSLRAENEESNREERGYSNRLGVQGVGLALLICVLWGAPKN